MGISKTDWKYLTAFRRCLRITPKSITAQRNMAHKTSSANLFFCAALSCCTCVCAILSGCIFAVFRVNMTLIRIPPCLLTLPSFSKHLEHTSSQDHDSTARHNLSFTDGTMKVLTLRLISLSYRSLGKYHISNPAILLLSTVNNEKQGDQTALPMMLPLL